ncbi:MAG: hypothetical protein ABFR19_02985 [Pseudomonadota bacterium]
MITVNQNGNFMITDPMLVRVIWILVLWLTGVLLLGNTGMLNDSELMPLVFGVTVILPPLLAWLAWRSFVSVRAFVSGIDVRILILLHSFRTVGFGFLILYAHDMLHPLFAFPAAIGDIATAFAALTLGILLFKGIDLPTNAVRRWNTFGLIDFAIAVIAGITMRSALLGSENLNTDLMGSFPLMIFPTFLVPMMIIVHLMIYAKLSQQNHLTGARL